jgi:tRNA threonylcarbamoyladenosine biosynthesis protein TsaE
MILHKDIDSLEVTKQLAETIASTLRGGEVIELVSDVGGGKTTFTKYLVSALGSTDVVSSPTFTVSKIYHAPVATIYHYDFYRLNNPNYVKEALAENIQDAEAITIIEWGGLVDDVLPLNRLKITIQKHPSIESARSVTFESTDQNDYMLKDLV